MGSPPQNTDGSFTCSHHHRSAISEAATFSKVFFWLQIAFVLAVVFSFLIYRQTPAFSTLSITFVSIFLEALPFMLLGALLGGLIEVFVSEQRLTRLLPASRAGSILMAAGIGMLFPVCECAIIPIVRRLFQKGFPLGAGIAFLLAGPIVNPLVFFSTAVAYGYNWAIALERLLYGYLIAVAVGFFVDMIFNRRSALITGVDVTGSDADHHCRIGQTGRDNTFLHKVVTALQHAADDFLDIGRFLVFGAFIAGLLQAFISRGAFTAVLASPAAAILAMMGLAVVLNLCSEADAFVAASFRTTLPAEAQMAFMVLGPMLDVKLILMYFRVFKQRLIVSLAGTVSALVFLMMWLKASAGMWP